MEPLNNDLVGLGATAIAVVIILRLVFDFIVKMKNRPQKANEEASPYIGFTEADSQCLQKVEYQVNEMYSGLQVNKELQRALADVVGMQEQQTAILNQLTKLTASSQELLAKIAGKFDG